MNKSPESKKSVSKIVQATTALVAPLALFAAGCDKQPSITSGTVISKAVIAGYNWTYEDPIPNTICTEEDEDVNNTIEEFPICTTTFTYVPVSEYQGPQNQITFQNCDVKDKNDKCAQRTVDVSKQAYADTNVGGQINILATINR